MTPQRARGAAVRACAAAIVLASLAGAAPGCATGGSGGGSDDGGDGLPRGESDLRAEGDRLLEIGLPDRAATAYERALAASPGDPILTEKLRTALRLAAQRHAESALRAADRGDQATAARELSRARAMAADAPAVRRALDTLDARVSAGERAEGAKAAARELMPTEPARAADILADARREAPHDLEIVEMLQQATLAAEADRSAVRAGEAWAAGDRERAVRELKGARHGDREAPAAATLRRRMASDLVAEVPASDLPGLRARWKLALAATLDGATADHLRAAYADRLVSEARAHGAGGRVGLAALMETEAALAGSKAPTPHADRVRGEVAVEIAVLPFDDAPDGTVDGLRLARALRDRIRLDAANGQAALRVTEREPSDGRPAIVVRGAALTSRRSSGRLGTENVAVRYATGTREVENPESAALLAKLAEVRGRLSAAEDEQALEESRLKELEALPFQRGPQGAVTPPGDAAYQTRIARAKAAADAARRKTEKVRGEEATLRRSVAATPSTSTETLWAETSREVTTLLRTSQLTARIVVSGPGDAAADETLSAAAEHRETVAPAVPQARIPADRDESPGDDVMAALAADRFAALASGLVREAAVRAARPLLQEARARERSGDAAQAADLYARYLFATPAASSPERADAARAVEELAGLRSTFTIQADAPPERRP